MEYHAAELIVFHLLILQKPPDLRLRLFCVDVVEPVGLWRLTAVCLNLHAVTVAQHITYRLHLAVDTRSDALTADLGVYFESKIKDCGAHRKLFHLPLRRDDVNLVRLALGGSLIVKRIEVRLVSILKDSTYLI